MSIGILSCVWKRPERLEYTLDQLAAQDYDDWHLYLINNEPELVPLVEDKVKEYALPMTVIHNAENRGPFARWEVAHKYADQHDYFMTIDDDVLFNDDLLSSWQAQACDEVMGWNGFIFQSDYWHRLNVEPGQPCHYVWGSNMLVPASVVALPAVLELSRDYWQCDDLWMCYIASHKAGLTVRRANIEVCIEDDGKDTYLGQHRNKVLFLEILRKAGWAKWAG